MEGRQGTGLQDSNSHNPIASRPAQDVTQGQEDLILNQSAHQRVGTFDTIWSVQSQDDSWEPQYVLSLDGGGVRGYSSLLILKELMTRIESIERQHQDPAESSLHPHKAVAHSDSHTNGNGVENLASCFYPCHYFDYMFGTSTGGLIAIMLSRLRMNVDDALEEYRTLAGEVFGHPRIASMRGPIPWPIGKFNSERLKNAVNGVVARQALKRSAVRQQPQGQQPGDETFNSEPMMCRTVCLAYAHFENQDTLEVPFHFRSYEHLTTGYIIERNPGPAHCYPIWQVARATSAAPTYFDRMKIGDSHTFWDGGFGCNNPSFEAYQEVLQMNNQSKNAVALLLSIGTGESRISRFAKGKWAQFYQFLKAAKKLASDSQEVHNKMIAFSENGRLFPYYRLSVREGLSEMKLDEWKEASRRGKPSSSTLDTMTSVTKEYLQNGFVDRNNTITVQQHLTEVAERLVAARRLRAGTPRWETVALGVRYRCPIERCPRGQQPHYTKQLIWRHLCKHHNQPMPDDCTAQQKVEIEALIKSGRVEH